MRRVVIVAFADVQSLDVVGPVEVFASAGGYGVEVVAPAAGLVRASSGLGLWADGAMAEDDVGRDVALAVARRLVVFLKRPGGQSQFSAQLAGQLAERQPLSELQAWIADHLDDDLSVERLAERAAMSVRNFSRTFSRQVGVTPARFVERARVDGARRLLEESAASVDEIATRCGFGTPETMRRTF